MTISESLRKDSGQRWMVSFAACEADDVGDVGDVESGNRACNGTLKSPHKTIRSDWPEESDIAVCSELSNAGQLKSL